MFDTQTRFGCARLRNADGVAGDTMSDCESSRCDVERPDSANRVDPRKGHINVESRLAGHFT